jgi:octaprenyl-diphosphate synthase
MSIAKISEPVKSDLEQFNSYFRDIMKTDVSLLTIIIRYIAKKKGKQIRPVLVFLSAGLTGEISQRAHVGAAMIELLHTATLIHDDVVDEAKVRRGIASIPASWNNKVAVLVGDFLLSLGLQTSVKNDEFQFLKVTSRAVQEMSEGELLAIDKSKKSDLDEETYFRIIRGKTASLIASCTEIGAISTSDSKDVQEDLRLAGEYLGMAFQIRDDLFDYVSKSSIIGKPVGNDIKEKKITLPLIAALDNHEGRDSKKIIKIVKSGKANKSEINQVIEFVRANGGVDYAQKKAEEFVNKANEIFDKYPDSIYKTALKDLGAYIINRDS